MLGEGRWWRCWRLGRDGSREGRCGGTVVVLACCWDSWIRWDPEVDAP